MGRKTRQLPGVAYPFAAQHPQRSAISRWRGRILVAVVLVVLVLASVKGWRIYTAAQALLADTRALAALARTQPRSAALADAGPLLAQTRADAAYLRAEAAPFFPLTRRLGWVPTIGGDLVAAEPLLDTAVALSSAADEGLAALAPLVRESQGQPAQALLRELPAIAPQLESAHRSAARAAEAWSLVQTERLSPRLRAQVQRLDMILPLAQAGLGAAPILPAVAEDLRQLDALTQTKLDAATFDKLEPLLRKTHTDLVALRGAAAPQISAAEPLRDVPGYGAELAAAKPLLDAAIALARAADESVVGLTPIVRPAQDAAPLARRLLAARPQLEKARGTAIQADVLWRRVPVETFTGALQTRLRAIAPLLTQTQKALDLALIAPELLGAGGRREYLLLAQNPDELRATGGFISGVGALTIDNSRVGDFALENSPTADNFKTVVYPVPPKPLRQYMGIEQWVLRDANWSPDFPTVARNISYLYQLTQGRDIPDVLAFEPSAVRHLLEAIGPVSVDDFPEPVSADNLVEYMRSQYNRQFLTGRKEFLETLGKAMIARIESAPAGLDAVALSRAALRALDERSLLIAVDDPATAAILSRRGWDGAVRPGDADFLMVVDSNIGYNKVNPNIGQSLAYAVDLADPDAPHAELSVRHANRTSSPGECRHVQSGLTGPNWYEQRLVGCYWDYLRVLAPGGSQLTGADTQPTPGKWLVSGFSDDGSVGQQEGDAGTTELSALVVVPGGAERTTVFRYRLPAAVVAREDDTWRYRLRVQKQPARALQSCVVTIRPPRGFELASSSAAPAIQPDGTLRFALDLATDQEVEVVFRLRGAG
jgi:hypothetical protein